MLRGLQREGQRFSGVSISGVFGNRISVAGVPFVPQPKLELAYKGRKLGSEFQPDLVCYGCIVVELKAMSDLTDSCRAQLHNYLKATGHRLGLLVNFGHY